jgi:hypothetical protein
MQKSRRRKKSRRRQKPRRRTSRIQKSGRKLDGVCPVDNRPSTDKLHHFVKKKKKKWYM